MNNSLQFTVIVYRAVTEVRRIVYEAMMRLAWKGLLLWIHVNHGAEVNHLEELILVQSEEGVSVHPPEINF